MESNLKIMKKKISYKTLQINLHNPQINLKIMRTHTKSIINKNKIFMIQMFRIIQNNRISTMI